MSKSHDSSATCPTSGALSTAERAAHARAAKAPVAPEAVGRGHHSGKPPRKIRGAIGVDMPKPIKLRVITPTGDSAETEAELYLSTQHDLPVRNVRIGALNTVDDCEMEMTRIFRSMRNGTVPTRSGKRLIDSLKIITDVKQGAILEQKVHELVSQIEGKMLSRGVK